VLQSAGIEITDETSLEACVGQIREEFWKTEGKNKTLTVAQELSRISNHLIIVMDNGTFYLNKDLGHIQFMPNFKRANVTYVANELGIYIASFLKHGLANCKIGDAEAVNGSIRLAMLAYCQLFNTGIAADRDKSKEKAKEWSPINVLSTILSTSQEEGLKKIIENEDNKQDQYLFSSLKFERTTTKTWKRTDCYEEELKQFQSGAGDGTVFHRIIRDGVENALRTKRSSNLGSAEVPIASIQCPYAEFGKIKLIDSDDIEQYSNCWRVIRSYLDNTNWQKPLSISVFGKPGIGKSFAVRELVKLNPNDRDEPPLVFNLAQFNSLDQLTECFHIIQSAVLDSRGRPPLIMFDEFDSDFAGTLGWLKYFLAPMQDGEFRGKSGTYKIGRAIFAFAGGTSESFKDFQERRPKASEAKPSRPTEAPATKLENTTGAEPSGAASKPELELEDEKLSAEIQELHRSAKLPDFVSRLHGHLNLTDLGEGNNINHVNLLKRAMLIRTFLEQHHGKSIFSGDEKKLGAANIDSDVMNYFLKRSSYPFGTRSLETIIRGSTSINNRLVMASLPPDAQIAHHGGSRKTPMPNNLGALHN
jgi:hypothetical protein